MGSVYRRGDSPNWWIAYKDESSVRVLVSAKTEDKAVALERLAMFEQAVAAKKALGITEVGPLTVEKWSKRWLAKQREKKLVSVHDDEQRLEDYILPRIGSMPLASVKPSHVQDVIDRAVAKGRAPRTVHLINGTMRLMFKAAQKKGLVPASPVIGTVRDGDLPKKRDKNLGWRDEAVFSRHEVEALLFDTRLPEAHRVVWALVLLGGMRIGEACARRWSDIDDNFRPLPKMRIHDAWATDRKELRAGGKTGVAREMPLHPTLGAILQHWRHGGGLGSWLQQVDRPWRRKADSADLIVPGPRGGHLNANTSWRWLKAELQLLGFRHRRQHDARATFVSLLDESGANQLITNVIVWGREPTVRGGYSRLSWAAKCAEVLKLSLPVPSEVAATQIYAVSKGAE